MQLGAKAGAAQFEAYSPMIEAGGGDVNTGDTSWLVEVTDNPYLVRFVANGTYLNSQAVGVTPKFATGIGAWSVWYVHNFAKMHVLTMNITVGDLTEVITKLCCEGDVIVYPEYEGFVCEQGKEYIMGSEDVTIVLTYSDATGIEEVKGENGTEGRRPEGLKSKVEGIYDLQGRKVVNPSNGLYIVDGKKTYIK